MSAPVRPSISENGEMSPSHQLKRKHAAESTGSPPKRQLRDCPPLDDIDQCLHSCSCSASLSSTPSSSSSSSSSPALCSSNSPPLCPSNSLPLCPSDCPSQPSEECIWRSVARTLAKADSIRQSLAVIAQSQAVIASRLDEAEKETEQMNASYDRMIEGYDRMAHVCRQMASELPPLPRGLWFTGTLPARVRHEGGEVGRRKRRRRRDYRSMWDQTTPGGRWRTDHRGLFDQ